MRFSQSKGRFSRNLLAAAILTPTLVLTGCFFDDDDDDKPGSGGGSTSSASGLVYDGYLIGATVCVDLNLNKGCDASEPSSTTDADGNFNITGLTETQAKYPLVMESTADTEDSDNLGVKVGTGLKFLAPAGSSTVSAYSTIIQAKIEAKLAANPNKTLAELKTEATTELATALGVSGVDLANYDPIATKAGTASDADKLTAAKLHLINQVLSNQVKQNLDALEAKAGNAGVSAGAAAAVLLSKLDGGLATILADVEDTIQTAGGGYNEIVALQATDVVLTNPVDVNAITTDELEDQQDLEDAAKEAIQEELGEDNSTGGTGATGGTGGTI